MSNVTNFTANVTTGSAPLTVIFTDTSSPTPTGWLWDFGDLTSSNLQNPTHTYTSPGVYSVTLTPSAGYPSNTRIHYITVNSSGILTGGVAASHIVSQSGQIVYDSSDATDSVRLSINGIVDIRDNLYTGTISTKLGQDLYVRTGTGGNLFLEPDGDIILNGVTWPGGTLNATPGSYLGASSTNTLIFYPFIIGFNGSDTLTQTQLNTTYPAAQSGQSVVGPTVIYQCVGSGEWRRLSDSASGSVSSVNVTGGTTGLTTSGGPITSSGTIVLDGTLSTTHGGTGLATIGTSNQIIGVNNSASGLEYKTFLAGAGISIIPSTNTLTVTNTGIHSVQGTVNQISSSSLTGDTVLSVASTFVAPGSLQYSTLFGYTNEFISAAGTNQSTATVVTKTISIITSGLTAQGVSLPIPTFIGELHIIENKSGNIIYIWPQVGASIDNLPTNTNTYLETEKTVRFLWNSYNWVNDTGNSISAGNIGISVNKSAGNISISNLGVLSFSAGTTGLNPAVSTTGDITLGGILSIGSGGTGHTSPTTAFDALSPSIISGDLIYFNGSNNVRLPVGSNTNILSVVAGSPGWVTLSSINAGSSTISANIAGGSTGSIPYQTSINNTAFLSPGTSSQVLISGSTPSWVSVPTALGYTPVNNAGGTMTGPLVLSADPVSNLGAATKQYVDTISTGLIWLQPIQDSNIIGDASSPPSPVQGQSYIINTGGNTGVWASFSAGDIVKYNSGSWGLVLTPSVGTRLGVSFALSSTPINSFAGHKNYIAVISGGTPGAWAYSFTAPANNYALYVNNTLSIYNGISYTYSTLLTQWVQFSISTTYTAGTGLSLVGTQFSNIGVLSNIAGSGITLSGSTGNVTITNTGVTGIISGSGINVSSSTGNVTISAVSLPSVNVNTTYTIQHNDYSVFADGTSGGFTLNLPASPTANEIHNIKKVDQTRTLIIINGNGHNIDKYSSITIDVPFISLQLQWNATSSIWYII